MFPNGQVKQHKGILYSSFANHTAQRLCMKACNEVSGEGPHRKVGLRSALNGNDTATVVVSFVI